jgi:hypothetical protein
MHSLEPMVVLHTRSASEGIPSRDSVYNSSQSYNICGAVWNAPNPQRLKCSLAFGSDGQPRVVPGLHTLSGDAYRRKAVIP